MFTFTSPRGGHHSEKQKSNRYPVSNRGMNGEILWVVQCLDVVLFLDVGSLKHLGYVSKFFHLLTSCHRLCESTSRKVNSNFIIIFPHTAILEAYTDYLSFSKLYQILITLSKGNQPDLNSLSDRSSWKCLQFQPISHFLLPAKLYQHQLILKELSYNIVQNIVAHQTCIQYINSSKGFGVFAKRTIVRGSAIAIYLGEVISKEEARRRYEQYDKEGLNYVMVIKEHSLQHDFIMTSIFDATYYGNESRFINHSCDPNCEIVMQRSHEHQVFGVPVVIALKTIPAGNEITISYCSTDINQETKATKSTSSTVAGKRCLCNAHCCSGTLPQC